MMMNNRSILWLGVATAMVLLVVAAVLKTSVPFSSSSNQQETTNDRRQRQRQMQRAKIVGNNGEGKWPMGVCEGDCDSDEDCADGLTCFQRGPGEAILGCTNAPSHGADYCIDNTASRTGRNSNTDGVADIVGNDDDSWFPLGLCQGDCDSDDDCQDGLYCFQRNNGEVIPGCRGIPDSASDFCVRKDAGGSGGGDVPQQADESQAFLLKMYWEEGYMWQENPSEKWWCMDCDGNCQAGKNILIVDCENGGPTYWRFVYYDDGEIQVKVDGRDLCMEINMDRNVARLGECSSSNINQRFVSYRGDLRTGSRFELSPVARNPWCVTQDHHPKNREKLLIEPCFIPRGDTTNYWMKY